MAIFERSPIYRTYQVTMWEKQSQNPAFFRVPWRFRLEDLHIDKRHGFASLEGVMAVMRSQLVGW
jgi:hypothetical protein